jgi:hypothetical protein
MGILLFPILAVGLNAAPINTCDHLLKTDHHNNSYTPKNHYAATVTTTPCHHATYNRLRQGSQTATTTTHDTHLRCALETLPPSRRTTANPRPSITYAASGRGIWPSRDPIEEKGGVNLYAFVGNNPIGKWDYLGLTIFIIPLDGPLRDFIDDQVYINQNSPDSEVVKSNIESEYQKIIDKYKDYLNAVDTDQIEKIIKAGKDWKKLIKWTNEICSKNKSTGPHYVADYTTTKKMIYSNTIKFYWSISRGGKEIKRFKDVASASVSVTPIIDLTAHMYVTCKCKNKSGEEIWVPNIWYADPYVKGSIEASYSAKWTYGWNKEWSDSQTIKVFDKGFPVIRLN